MNKQVILKKNEELRVLNGHQWVFSNEIKETSGNLQAGDVAELHRHDGMFLGIGFFHPNSLISFRFLSSEDEEISEPFFSKRISAAYELRKKLYPDSETFRLVHGESDFLPGLIIDKYDDYISVQTFCAGMDLRLETICETLESLFHPKAIIERNESPLRSLENLPERKGVLRGSFEESIIVENDIKLSINLLSGQKTGIFLDQRENRQRIRRYVKNARVLDGFCNEGGFSLNASFGGAQSILSIDISGYAIDRAKENAVLNQFKNIDFLTADVFDELKNLVNTNKKFDVVILDPPSFARSKRSVPTALKGYREINSLGLELLNAGGFLVTASCSHHVSEEDFLHTVERAAQKKKRKIQLIELHGASPDHPVLPAMPETKYLKFAIFHVQ